MELIIGGVRSGKSRLAEQRATATGAPVVYVATAQAGDEAMRARIERHRRRRPAEWRTLECDAALADCLRRCDEPGRCLLVDCLTLWMTRLIETPDTLNRECEALLSALPRLRGDIIMVSNEVGLGVVPMGEVSRLFVDRAGALHREIASLCNRVTLVAAGLPLTLKDSST